MRESSGCDVPNSEKPGKDAGINVSRRRLLRMLAASSGIIAVSAALPDKWTQPIVEAGDLPPRGETSSLVDSVEIGPVEVQPMMTVGGYMGRFSYDDPAGGVSDGSTQLYVRVGPCGDTPWVQIFNGETLLDLGMSAYMQGTAYQGTINFLFVTDCGNLVTPPQLCVRIVVSGRPSNERCAPLSGHTMIPIDP